MNIASTQLDNQKMEHLEIYLSGCKAPHCEGCHNPELWDFNSGTYFDDCLDSIIEKCNKYSIKTVWVMGGEPLNQEPLKLESMLTSFGAAGIDVVLFTRYKHIPAYILTLCSYVKFGAYEKHSKPYKEHILGLTLASENQRVVKVDRKKWYDMPRNYLVNLKTLL